MLLAWLASSAMAADWLLIQGTEAGRADEWARMFGFAQAAVDVVVPMAAEGLTSEAYAAHDGEVPSANRIGTGDAAWDVNLRRARLGARGSIAETGQRVNWLMAFEMGTSAVTRTQRVVPIDASLTWSVAPGLRVRVGQFKLPMMDETLESIPTAAATLNTSQTAGLLQESVVTNGAYASGTNGGRDVGVQAFDAVPVGPVELQYAVMVSNGSVGGRDTTTPKDLTARVSVTRVLDGGKPTDPHRHEVSAFAWRQQGERIWDDATSGRVRQGVGIHVETAPVRARAEVVQAVGFLDLGSTFPGMPVDVRVEGEALGVVGMLHGNLGEWGATARVEQLWRGLEDDASLRVLRTVTLGADVYLAPKARIMADVELRSAEAPYGSADAMILADALAPRAALQGTILF